VLWADGMDITTKTLLERRAVLASIIKPKSGIQSGSYVADKGKALFGLAKTKGMEGIVAKRKNSIYRPGVPLSLEPKRTLSPNLRLQRKE
jgi:ATP-dependent DNA ligase